MLNILRAKVEKVGVIDLKGYSVDIELDAGRPILATITRKSLANLNLQPGQPIYVHIKAIKMVHHSAVWPSKLCRLVLKVVLESRPGYKIGCARGTVC